jgi:hypothetical protein
VPTARPRYQITETTEVARALDLAAKRWPGESRVKLLRQLVGVARNTLEHDQHAEDGARHAAARANSSRYAEALPARNDIAAAATRERV